MKYILVFVFIISSYIQLPAQYVEFILSEKDLIPEGITYDPAGDRFYISSIFKNKIVSISNNGESDFIKSGEYGFTGGVGLHVDPERNILWACSGNIMGATFRTGIFAFDLKEKKLIKKIYFPIDTLKRFFNDLVIAGDGSVYITDTFGHKIWKWNVSMVEPEALSLTGNVENPNGIVISPDNKKLIVTTRTGLKIIDLSNGMCHHIQSPAGSIPSTGLDGIAFYKNSIIGIQNDIKPRTETKIARYYLDENMNRIIKTEVIDINNKYFDIPTTLVLADNNLYVIANSQLLNLDQEKIEIINPRKLTKPVILKYSLK